MRTGILIALVTMTTGCATPPPSIAPQSSIATCGHAVVVLVRHAEKASNDADAELSPAGVERAKRIAIALGSAGVTRLVATDVRRTQQTLAPLAEKLGKPIDVRPAKDVDGLARELAASPSGSIVVVAHHSNGIPRLTRAFGVEPRGLSPSDDALGEKELGRMIVLTLDCDRKHATAIELSSDSDH